MTIAEFQRFLRSYTRREKLRAQEQATHNYILAGLMGRAFASCLTDEIEMPKLEEVYSSLFTEQAEEIKQKKQDLTTDISVIRFKQFASFHNKKFEQQEVATLTDE